jgi:hypothetical protein
MVFLNPSILLGLIAASIPILIHILNFRKLQKVEFSTLSFLKELQKSKIKKIKIKQWLLLLLRTLIIIFIVLAFARPTLENVSLGASTTTAKSSSVFILDNSFSMSYFGDEGSNFNRSKKIAKDIISKMEEGDNFIILPSINTVQTTTSKETAIEYINELEIDQVTELTSLKLIKAISELRKSQNINKEIFLFSDFQSSTFMDESENDSIKLNIFDNIKLYSFNVSSSNSSNYSVSNLILENSIIERDKPLIFSASVKNFSDDAINNITASLFINNKRVGQQSINLNGRDGKIIKFETSISTGGLIEVRVELEQDNIIHDNISHLSFIVPEQIEILLLYDNIEDIKFVESALSSITEQIKITRNSIKESSYSKLSNFDLIFYVSSYTNESLDIRNYLNQGGNLFFIPPSSISENELIKLNKLIGLPNVNRIIKTNVNEQNYLEFGEIDFEHPIFLTLFENNAKKKIESANIFQFIKFEEPNSINSIIRLIDKSIFLGEYNVSKGKVLYLNTSAVLSWGNFPIKGIFAPLISRIVFYLSSNNEKMTTYITGESIPINAGELTYPLIDVDLPEGEDKLNLQNNTDNWLKYNFTGIPGNYKFYNNNQLLFSSSVNTDPRESDLTLIEKDSLEDYYKNIFNDNYLIIDADDNYYDKINQARYGTELWKYLIIIVLLLALVEMYIARSTKKDLISLNEKRF